MAQISGRQESLDQSIALFRDCLMIEAQHQDPAITYSTIQKLGDAYFLRSGLTESLNDLEECGRYYHDALSLQPSNCSSGAYDLHNLSAFYFRRFKKTKNRDDSLTCIDFAVRALRHADPENLVPYARGVATSYIAQYMEFGGSSNFDEAIKHIFIVLSSDPQHNHDARKAAFHELRVVLSVRLEGEKAHLASIDESLKYCREALGPPPHDDPILRPVLLMMPQLLTLRYEATGDESSLAEALRFRDVCVQLVPQSGTPEPVGTAHPSASIREATEAEIAALESIPQRTELSNKPVDVPTPPPAGPPTKLTTSVPIVSFRALILISSIVWLSTGGLFAMLPILILVLIS